MNKIVRKEQFSEKVFLFEIEAPLIANSRKAGNFVIVRVGQKGERMPLTIAGADKDKGTITLVVQQVGLSSKKLRLRHRYRRSSGKSHAYREIRYGSLRWWWSGRCSDAANHSGTESCWQPCAVCDGWSFQGLDYPGGQGS